LISSIGRGHCPANPSIVCGTRRRRIIACAYAMRTRMFGRVVVWLLGIETPHLVRSTRAVHALRRYLPVTIAHAAVLLALSESGPAFLCGPLVVANGSGCGIHSERGVRFREEEGPALLNSHWLGMYSCKPWMSVCAHNLIQRLYLFETQWKREVGRTARRTFIIFCFWSSESEGEGIATRRLFQSVRALSLKRPISPMQLQK
jgi:hypothetical protein